MLPTQVEDSDHLVSLYHKWLTIPEPLQFNADDLNNALLKDPALKLDMKAEKRLQISLGSITILTGHRIQNKEIIATTSVIRMEMKMSTVQQQVKHGTTLSQNWLMRSRHWSVRLATRNNDSFRPT